MFSQPDAENTKFYNLTVAGAVTESAYHYVKLGAGRLQHILLNSTSGSSQAVGVYDGYLSASDSASGSPVTHSWTYTFVGDLVGSLPLTGLGVGTQFKYNLVFNKGLAIQTIPTGSVDLTIIYE